MIQAQFQVIRFSPNPEEGEAANVAIVLSDGRSHLVVDDDFPRLSCSWPDFDRTLLREYLSLLSEQLSTTHEADLATALSRASSQFRVTEPRSINVPVNQRLIAILKAKYLQRTGPRAAVAPASHDETYVDSILQEFLVSRVGVADNRMMRRARPADFLPVRIVEKYFPHERPHVSRVIRGGTEVLLIEAINRAVRPLEYLERRATRIGSIFFRVGRAARVMERAWKQNVRRATVLFGEVDPAAEQRLDYIEGLVREQSDFVVDSVSPEPAFISAAHSAMAL